MDIRVSGHQVATGEALTTHVETRLQAIADKYFARAISAKTTFGRGPHDNGFSCDIIAHVMQGLILKLTNGSGGSATITSGSLLINIPPPPAPTEIGRAHV